MRLHLLSIPHTVTDETFSHCAFTGKVARFSPMLRAQGYEVIHYGVAGAVSGATQDVELLTTEEHLALLGVSRYHENPARLVGMDAYYDRPVYRQFNHDARAALRERLEPGDVICLPFGAAHAAAIDGLPLVESGAVVAVETGIGYPNPCTLHRVYESEAWRHWIMGHEHRSGQPMGSKRMEWVIPNYYDVGAWQHIAAYTPSEATRVVYFGRIEDVKGVALIPQLAAARPEWEFIICGQGNPEPFLTQPNVTYMAPLHGTARAQLLASARAVVCPSQYVEPFCGVNVEAQLCGTPVLTTDFGAFTETVVHGVTGYRCRTLGQWLTALEAAPSLDSSYIAAHAAARYGMDAVGPMYRRVFEEIAERLTTQGAA